MKPGEIGWEGWWEGIQHGGDTCLPMADSYRCMAKAIRIL